jgi:hypothetical protein
MKEAANFLGLVLMLLVMFAMLGLADQQQDLGMTNSALERVVLAGLVIAFVLVMYPTIAETVSEINLRKELKLLPAFYRDPPPPLYLGRDAVYTRLATDLGPHAVSPDPARYTVILSSAAIWNKRHFLGYDPDVPAFDSRKVASKAAVVAALVSKQEKKGTLTPEQMSKIKETVAKLKID